MAETKKTTPRIFKSSELRAAWGTQCFQDHRAAWDGLRSMQGPNTRDEVLHLLETQLRYCYGFAVRIARNP